MGSQRKAGLAPVAIINKDDAIFEQFGQATPAEVISYSTTDASASFFASDITYSKEGTQFTLHLMGDLYPVQINSFGEYNVQNALAAIAATWSLGISLEVAIEALTEMQRVKGRLHPMANTEGYEVFVDYAHTPDGLENVLHALRPLAKGRIISVFGCRGGRDKAKRPIMGKIATESADFVVFTTDDPGNEDQEKIIEMVLSGTEKENYTYIEKRKTAIEYAVEMAEPGDIMVITGRGHEETYHIKGQEFHLIDYEIAQEAVNKKQRQIC